MRKLLVLSIITLVFLTFVIFFNGGKKEEGEKIEKKVELTSEWGDYSGITIKMKTLGGTMYEPLYERIPIWEEKTGAKVIIISKKPHPDIDREMKQDIAANTVDWDIGNNHTSFAPSYGDTFLDINEYISEDVLEPFVPRSLENCSVEGKLLQMPRHGDVSNIFYQKHLYEDEKLKKDFKAKYGYELKPPETTDEWRDQAIFFTDPPNFYGTIYVGKDEDVGGRFMEMLYCYGGKLFDENWKPVFNSKEGVGALQWFKDLYDAKAVPLGVVNYKWDDTGLGFASGTIAIDLDWSGWAAFFGDPESSKVAGNIGITRGPTGPSGMRTGWSGWHSFSVTSNSKNKEAAIALVLFLTNYESQMLEARRGLLPARKKVWDDVKKEFEAKDDQYMTDVFTLFKMTIYEDAYTPPLIPEWVPLTDVLYPEIQAAILGDKTIKQALDDAAKGAEQLMERAGYY